MLKGGLALQLRLGQRARTTKDIDVLLVTPPTDLHALLIGAAQIDLRDWFELEVARPARGLPAQFGGERFHVHCLLDGRRFESFHLDVGLSDPLLEPVEHLAMPGLLEFAGIPPTVLPCYSVVQQIAEKVHAYTRPYQAGESTRVKDLVDTLLMAGMGEIGGPSLRQVIQATFDARGSHPIPAFLPDPPASWSTSFRKLATEVGLGYQTLVNAGQAARRFLDPVLQGETIGTWNPAAWSWQS